MKPTLNLGCGSDKWGDVRLDIRETKSTNFVFDFDSLPLPFADKQFSQCRVWHVLEHSRNPRRLLSEAIRVSDVVHAKFPYKYDRIPLVLAMVTTFHPTIWYRAVRDCFWHIMTQLGLADSPWSHRWLIQPFGKCQLNRVEMFSFLHGSRTQAKFLKSVPLPSLKGEWECWTR